MDVAIQDQVLREVANGEPMDYHIWPKLLPCIIERIETISRTRFRIPTLSPPRPDYPIVIQNSQPDKSGPQSELQIKNGTAVATFSAAAIPNSPSGPATGPPQGQQPSSSSFVSIPSEDPSSSDQLPPQITNMLDEITRTINDGFPRYPPHTMQRLAELVVEPTRHYKHLVPYLHALDRVVHVTSGANVYPLPPAVPDMSALQFLSLGAGITNGADLSSVSTAAAVEAISWAHPTSTAPTDESQLGGALLTPIPWLARQAEEAAAATGASSAATVVAGTTSAVGQGEFRTESTETIDGPNGMGSIETVSINLNGLIPSGSPVIPAGVIVGAGTNARAGVTQGELLRQEQRAGVVPKTQLDKTSAAGEEMEDVDAAAARGARAWGERTAPADAEDNEATTDNEAEDEDEKPHARGPGEIGDADLGPQKSGMVGVEMHGIDVEAAVGRKAVTPPHQPRGHSATVGGDGQDKSVSAGGEEEDSDEDDAASKALSPKREAEEELGGLAVKRARTEVAAASAMHSKKNDDGKDVWSKGKDNQTDVDAAAAPEKEDEAPREPWGGDG